MRNHKAETNTINELKLLSRDQVAGILSVSKMTIKRYERRGMLSPVYLSSRAIRYHSQDVQRLIQQPEG